jgi:hypothetical protein
MLLRVLATVVGAMERGNGRGKEMPCSRPKERESPGADPDPRREKVTMMGKSKVIAIDAEQRDIGPIHAAPPNTLLTFTNRTKTKVKVNMSLTSPMSLKLNLRSATTAQVVVTSKWAKVKMTFLEVTLIYMETCSNLHKVMLPNAMSTCVGFISMGFDHACSQRAFVTW